MIDSYGRIIDYVRISVTDACNLRCIYCMPNAQKETSQPLKDDIISIAAAFIELGAKKIRLTGGEPLLRNDIVEIVSDIRSLSPDVKIAMTTNGVLLGEKAMMLKEAGLDRLNISLDSLSEESFLSITGRNSLYRVKEGISKAREAGFDDIRINAVLLKGINENEIDSLIGFAKENAIILRFIELMPIGESVELYKKHYLNLISIMEKREDLIPLKREPGETSEYYGFTDSKAKVGLIRPVSCDFCSDCNRVRVTSKGVLRLCLHGNAKKDLKPFINDNKKLKEEIIDALSSKPKSHELSKEKYVLKGMNQIGG